jgi:hypothetical protein
VCRPPKSYSAWRAEMLEPSVNRIRNRRPVDDSYSRSATLLRSGMQIAFRGCFRVVDLMLDDSPELIPVDEPLPRGMVHLIERRCLAILRVVPFFSLARIE